MAGFIILRDGRAYASANWAYDAVIDAISQALPNNKAGVRLAEYLLEQRVCVRGIGSVDVRELTLENQQLLLAAIKEAFETAIKRGPSGWHDPVCFDGWIDRFGDLVNMIDSVRRGEPAMQFNPHMIDVIPPTGERAGPGWDEVVEP